MEIKIKSQRQGNWIGFALVFPDGTYSTVAMIEMPPDGDWRANIEFYDELVKLYRNRLKKFIGK